MSKDTDTISRAEGKIDSHIDTCEARWSQNEKTLDKMQGDIDKINNNLWLNHRQQVRLVVGGVLLLLVGLVVNTVLANI